ncbi:MAG: aspartate kinase [Bacteroidota bacterium]
MITIAQTVQQLLAEHPFIPEAMTAGLINHSALARQLIPEIEKRLHKKVEPGAVIMSLKRFSPQAELSNHVRIRKIMKNVGEVIVRSNLSRITFQNTDSLFEKLNRTLSIQKASRDVMFTYVRGVFETTLIGSSPYLQMLTPSLKKEKILVQNNHLSSVTLTLPKDNMDQPGLYNFILRQIAWEGINIREVISTSNEFTVIVSEKDVDKAFSVMNGMKKIH